MSQKKPQIPAAKGYEMAQRCWHFKLFFITKVKGEKKEHYPGTLIPNTCRWLWSTGGCQEPPANFTARSRVCSMPWVRAQEGREAHA